MANKEGVFTSRRKSREEAFLLIFEKSFFEDSIEEIIERARESRELDADDFTVKLASGVYEKLEAIDERISEFIKGWRLNRLSRVVLSILRLSAFEMLFFTEEVPHSVSINEAVELAKKYGGADDSSFINGVLGSMSRKLAKPEENGSVK